MINGVVYLRDPNPIAPRTDADNFTKSVDGGATWITIPTNCPPEGDACWHPNAIGVGSFAVNPVNPNIIMIGNAAGYRTVNGGQTWMEMGHWWGPDIHTDHRLFAFAPDGTAFDGNDGGLVRSDDDGAHWTNLNQNLSGALLYSVSLSRDDSMIAGTQDNGPIFSDRGAPWYAIYGGDSGHTIIDPRDSSFAYYNIMYYLGWVRVNWNGGQNLQTILSPPVTTDQACALLPPFTLNPSSPTHLLTACQQVVRSTNRGDTWTLIGGPLTTGANWYNSVNSICEAPSDPNVIYAVAEDFQKVFMTTNANAGPAATWTDISATLPGGTKSNAVVVHPLDPQTAYLACNNAVFMRIWANGQYRWVDLHAPTGRTYSDLAIDWDNTDRIFVSSDVGIFELSNSAWRDITAGVPAGMAVSGLSFNPFSRQLAAATYGRGVFVLDLDNVFPTVSITSPTQGITVSGMVTIQASAADNHRITGVRFRLDGNYVGNEDTTLPYSISWNAASASPGIHILTAEARDPSGNVTLSAPVSIRVRSIGPH